MRQWLRTRPDLQLTTRDGSRDPNSLDVSQPAALSYVTGIIDEYLTVFDTPFWHLGADEYGGLADAQDAFVDFVNQVNAHVKAKASGCGSGTTVSPVSRPSRWTPTSAKITGAKITLWPDNGSAETENEIEAQIFLPLRFIAQSTWGPTRPDPDFATFTRRTNTAGRSPGLIVDDPIPEGTVTLAVGGRFLAPAEPAAGTALTASATASDWRLERTPDGYYTIRHVATGLCAESRLGARDLNTPLEAGTPITAETCAAANRRHSP